MRTESGGSYAPSHFQNAPVSKFLIYSSIIVFILNLLMTPANAGIFFETGFQEWGKFSIDQAILKFQLWRVFSFQFLHADGMHLIFNMVGIYFFGPHVERWMTSRPFAFYYFFCGIAGALFYAFLYFLPGFFDAVEISRGMVGASAGIFGILAAFYKIAPNAQVLLFFFIPVKIRTAAILFFAYEVISILFDFDNAGGSAGHLGGALLGLSFIKYRPLRSWLIKVSRIGIEEPASSKTRNATVIRERPKSPLERNKEIDQILEKITQEGIHSLSPKERKTLDNARKK